MKNVLKLTAALVAMASLAACGACNCAVPGYTAGVAAVPAGTATVPPGAVVLAPGTVAIPPGVVPPAATPPPAALSCNQAAGAFALGPALAPFALLAGATITNTGNTIVTYAAGAVSGSFNDDLVGVSPGTAVVGFYPPGVVADGKNAIYAVGYNNTPAVPLAAEGALTTAFNTLAGMAAPPANVFPGGQDLSQANEPGYPTGTLPPGVYKSASTMGILAGNLTLNGNGNAQSVFVFQAGSALTTTLNAGVGGNIILTNGASACNVYWQVGTSAVLGGASFYGNVLAGASVTLTTSTQFTGRALARSGAVTISTATLVTDPGGS
jgi:hypothetical protein